MFKNYLKITLRYIIRNRLSAFINVVGLSVGLASAILIFLYVQYELGFDKYHKQYKNIYRINSVTEHSTGVDYKGCTTASLAKTLRLDYPDFDITLMRNEDSQHVKVNDDVYFEQNILFVDSVFFKIFDIEIVSGNYRDIIENKNSVLLTRELAEKYFGEKNPLDKIIKLEGKYPLKVAGIVENPPKHSSHPFSMIISYDFLFQEYIGLFNYDNWGTTMSGFGTYVALPDGYSRDDFQDKVNQTYIKYKPDKTPWEKRYILQSLSDIHFDERFQNVSNTYTINRSNILIYSFIGILIMIIASINFINLATAQAIKRSKEVGIRKVLGAVQSKIFSQFIFETIFLT
ncbi:MAG: ABC transporter permease, partial [Bacteroidales bacterium]|nr:ABC transporter permease [Bacteroidales bacterium]